MRDREELVRSLRSIARRLVREYMAALPTRTLEAFKSKLPRGRAVVTQVLELVTAHVALAEDDPELMQEIERSPDVVAAMLVRDALGDLETKGLSHVAEDGLRDFHEERFKQWLASAKGIESIEAELQREGAVLPRDFRGEEPGEDPHPEQIDVREAPKTGDRPRRKF
jgi:hypothetical protein